MLDVVITKRRNSQVPRLHQGNMNDFPSSKLSAHYELATKIPKEYQYLAG